MWTKQCPIKIKMERYADRDNYKKLSLKCSRWPAWVSSSQGVEESIESYNVLVLEFIKKQEKYFCTQHAQYDEFHFTCHCKSGKQGLKCRPLCYLSGFWSSDTDILVNIVRYRPILANIGSYHRSSNWYRNLMARVDVLTEKAVTLNSQKEGNNYVRLGIINTRQQFMPLCSHYMSTEINTLHQLVICYPKQPETCLTDRRSFYKHHFYSQEYPAKK